jgi:hypothetical protein
MASTNIWATILPQLINSGTLGLAALFGNHSSASTSATAPLAVLKSQLGSSTPNADLIKATAGTVAMLFASSNPAAAGTAAAIQANPSALAALLPMLESEIGAQNTNIMSSLAHAVSLANLSSTPTTAA